MKLDVYCTRWGYEHEPIEQFCDRAKREGYDGVEVTIAPDPEIARATADAIRSAGLGFIALRWSAPLASYEENLEEYERHLRVLSDVEPEFINSHTGIDWYTKRQNQAFLHAAARVTEETGVTIHHETHRGRFAFCAASTSDFLRDNPDITLTADFSHWCAVSESLLEDQQHLVDAAIERVEHIHCRVGYSQGPQVNDPRAPEWEGALDIHMSWWQKIVDRHRAMGSQRLTMTPEFGPWPYMVEQPRSREPIADQWAINRFMMDRVRRAFS